VLKFSTGVAMRIFRNPAFLLSLLTAFAMTTNAQVKLTPSDGGPGDGFGWTVAMDGDTAVVDAPLEMVGSNIDEGAVYVFVKSSIGWNQAAKLTASDGETGQEFGRGAVAISGNTIVIGGHGNSVYVYAEPPGGWSDMTQTAEITAYDPGNQFGYSVAISSDTKTIAVGAPDWGAGGDVFVYYEPSTGWANTSSFNVVMYPLGGNGCAGGTVAISGRLVFSGSATGEQSCFPSIPDDLYVYELPKGDRQVVNEIATLYQSNGSEGPYALAVSGNTVAMASLGDGLYVYVEPEGGWSGLLPETAFLGSTPGSGLGYSVAFLGTSIVGGEPLYSTGSTAPGALVEYKEPAGGWVNSSQPNAQITGPANSSPNPEFGWSVAASEGSVIVGAPVTTVNGNVYEGAAYIFGPKP
jgi:FG-GAP repeat